MSELTAVFDSLSATLFPMFVNLVWQFALLAGCVWLVTRVGWIRSAPTQYMLWLMCIFSPALLVCLGLLLPNANILLRERIGRSFRDAPTISEASMNLDRSEEESYQWMDEDPHVALTTQPADLQNSPTAASYAKNGSLSEMQPHLSTTSTPLVRSNSGIREVFAGWLSYAPLIVGLFWMAGIGFSLLRLGWGMFGLRKLRKSAKPITSGPLLELLGTIKDRMDVQRSVMIAVSHHVHAPISLGFWHPVILLPDNLEADNSEGLRLALIHELAHIRRHDVLVNWCQRTLAALCFFHPLFHLASRRLTQAREQICDNWVIQQSGKRGEYAAFLAGLLKSATSSGVVRAISLAVIPTKHSVSGRINMILEPRNIGKTSLTRKRAAIVLLLGMVLVMLLSATRILPMPSPTAQAQESDSQPAATSDENAATEPDTALLLSSAKVKGAAISEQKSENGGDKAIPATANPDPISVTLTGTAYREDGITPFAGAWVYVQPTIMDALSQSAPGMVGTTPHDLHSAQTAEGLRQQETSISGKVTAKADGKPMVGVKAWLGKLGRGTEANTDGDGKYTIVVKRFGENRLWVAADGFATSLTLITISQGKQLADVNIALVPGADVSGRVVDEGGNPIGEAEVWTVMNNAGMEPVKTDDQGQYIFKGLGVSRKYSMRASHPDYTDGWVEISVSKPGGLKASDIVLRAHTGITISGKVVNKSGEPVAGAEVVAGKPPYMSNSVKTKTDDAGRYAVKNVSEGDIFVIFKAEDYAPDLQKIRIKPGQDMRLDFTMKQGKGIAGKILDEDGNPVKDVHMAVSAWHNNRSVYHTVKWVQTDADGSFTVDNLPEISGMEIRASVMKDGYSRIDDIMIAPGLTDLEYVMETSGKIAGKVVDAQTAKPITDFTIRLNLPRFKPGEKAPRQGGLAATWARAGHRFVSPKGEFLASDFVLGGIYKLTAMAEGYTPFTIERVTTLAKPKADDLVIRLEKEMIIQGTVTDAITGNPVDNATIWHFNKTYPLVVSYWSNVSKAGTNSVQSGTDGLFSLAGSSKGNFLYVNHPQYAPIIVGPFEIKDTEESLSVTVKLRQGGKITGYAKSGAEPVSGERMDLSLIGGVTNLDLNDPLSDPHRAIRGEPAFGFTERAKITSDGYFEFDHIMPGEYRLTQMMVGEGFDSSVRMTEVKVSAGKTISLNFGGSGGAILRGRITDDEGAPIKNAIAYLRVNADPLGSGGADYTDSDGRYEIRDLPPGIHDLRARKHETWTSGGAIPSSMRFSGPLEVPEGSTEIEYDIKMTTQTVVPSRTVVPSGGTKSGSPVAIDSSGKEVRLPEDPINGDFEDGLTGWTKWQAKEDGSIHICEVVHDEERSSNVIEFRRIDSRNDGSRVGIAQDLYIDLSEYDELYLQIDMKPIYQSLRGGGRAGGNEYPVNIELTYIDEKGTGYRWQHGVYYKDESYYLDSSTKVPQSRWFTYISPNLKEILPIRADKLRVADALRWGAHFREYNPPVIPKVITRILIHGGGWDFIGRADGLQFRKSR